MFSIGLSVHPLFINKVFPYLAYLKIFGRIITFFSVYLLSYYLIKSKINRHVFIPLFVLTLIVMLSIISIINNSIELHPSVFILLIFILIFTLYYNIYFSKTYVKTQFYKVLKYRKIIIYAIKTLSIFLVFSIILELLIKFHPQFTDIKIFLRKSGNMVFPWRLTGFLLDANRWALFLLFLLYISITLKKHLDIENHSFDIIIFLYIFLTLSKTAFFILLMLFFINIKMIIKSLIFKKIIYFTVSIVIFLIFFTYIILPNFDYENSAIKRKIDFTVESISAPSKASTFKERIETYIAAINVIENNLIFGKGYLNFTVDTSKQRGITVHNTLLSLMGYFGAFLGILIYVFIFILPLVLLILKFGINQELLSFVMINLIFFNSLSVAHDLISVIMFYIAMTIYVITKRIEKNA